MCRKSSEKEKKGEKTRKFHFENNAIDYNNPNSF